MKQKTSITLSEDVMKTVKEAARRGESRSSTIERLLREGLAAQTQRRMDEKDMALLNTHADRLNAEAEDVLEYQGDL